MLRGRRRCTRLLERAAGRSAGRPPSLNWWTTLFGRLTQIGSARRLANRPRRLGQSIAKPLAQAGCRDGTLDAGDANGPLDWRGLGWKSHDLLLESGRGGMAAVNS